jgi:protein-S-isoprenylcysteine O-methyltransferase Ste14
MSENKKDHADVKIHPPILTLAHLIAAFILKRYASHPLPASAGMQTFGFILLVIAFLIAVAAIIEFRRANTTVNPHGSVSKIISSGVFRFTRNPIYLGFFIMLIGFPLYFGTYWGIPMAFLFLVSIYYLVIQFEEAYLEKKFGTKYTDYKSRVRRWI